MWQALYREVKKFIGIYKVETSLQNIIITTKYPIFSKKKKSRIGNIIIESKLLSFINEIRILWHNIFQKPVLFKARTVYYNDVYKNLCFISRVLYK